MSKHDKTFDRILSGTANANVDFGDLTALMNKLGFTERIKGSHHIYTKQGIANIVNLQPAKDGKAKPYQVKQVRLIIEGHSLKLK